MLIKLLNFFERGRKYKTMWVEDLPDNPERNCVYIIGGRKYPYYAAVVCPRKKCKNVVHLEISPEFQHRWKFKEHHDGSITLSPSIHVTELPCKCHYWIEWGRVIWAEWPSLFVPKSNCE